MPKFIRLNDEDSTRVDIEIMTEYYIKPRDTKTLRYHVLSAGDRVCSYDSEKDCQEDVARLDKIFKIDENQKLDELDGLIS